MLLSYDTSIPLLGKENETLGSHKNLYVIGYSIFIHNKKKLETLKMSISWSKDKQNMVYSTLKVIKYQCT